MFLEYNAVQGSMTIIDVKMNDLVCESWTVQCKNALDSPEGFVINHLAVDWS